MAKKTPAEVLAEYSGPLASMRKKANAGICPFCNKKITFALSEFRDDLSRKEFRISGLCQKCQDEFFVDPGE